VCQRDATVILQRIANAKKRQVRNAAQEIERIVCGVAQIDTERYSSDVEILRSGEFRGVRCRCDLADGAVVLRGDTVCSSRVDACEREPDWMESLTESVIRKRNPVSDPE
jgi:hypothetical protein